MNQRRSTKVKKEHQVAGTSRIPKPSAHDHTALFQKAFAIYQQGGLAESEELCKKILHSQPDHFDALQLLASITLKQNRLSDAVTLFEQAIHIKPGHFASLNNYGKTLLTLKRYEEALSSYDKALAIQPDNANTHCNRGVTLLMLKRYEEALLSYDRALAIQPDNANARYHRSVILQLLKRYEEALLSYDRALAIQPDNADIHCNRGVVLQALNRYEEALASYNKALAVQPDNADTHCNQGVVLQALNRHEEALASYERAIVLKPLYTIAYNNRSFSLLKLKRYDDALLSYDRMIELNMNYPASHYNRGNALLELKRYEEAILSYERAIKIKPDYAEAYSNRGNALSELKRFEEATASYNKALTLRPDERILSNLGNTLQKNGLYLTEAEACFRKALVLNPNYSEVHSNLLFFLTHDAKVTPEVLYQEHLAFGERLETQIKETPPAHDNPKILDRRLNIGFISGDFRNHPVASLIEPVWQMFDCEKFKLIAYYNYNTKDQVTERLRSQVHLWRQVYAMSDLSLAKQIRADKIDILVDLSGHTGFNRLPVFALKPAPVQMSCIGYPATTGLKTIDYRLMDKHTAPIGLLDWQFTEKLVYLPSSNVFHSYNNIPELNPLPALTSKVFTFGSFNRLSKIGNSVIELWCRVLKAIPGSRLLLGNASEKKQQELFTEIFKQHGVFRERLLFYPNMPMDDYLKLHHEVDLLLDSFPYSGGSTTNHGLSMGVPTITLAGLTLPSRHGVTVLSRVGLERFVAENRDEFIEIAVYWSTHLEELNEIRSEIRNRIKNSSTRSPELVARATESALRQMWQRWCAGLPPESFEVHL